MRCPRAIFWLGLLLAAGAWGQRAAYRLRPGDVVRVLVSPQGGIYSRAVKVHPSGHVYYPVVGEVRATGMTLPELQRLLQKELGAALQGHRVTVRPVQLAGGRAGGAGAAVRTPAGRAPAAAPGTPVGSGGAPETGREALPGGGRIAAPLESLEPATAQRVGAATREALAGGRLGSEGVGLGELASLVPLRTVGQANAATSFVLVPHAALLREQPVPEGWPRLPVGVLLVRGLAFDGPAAVPAGTLTVEAPVGRVAAYFLVARRTPEGGVLEAFGRGREAVYQVPLGETPAGQDLPIAFPAAREGEVGIEFRLPGKVTGAVGLGSGER